jgi:TetR/AcrR family transcriptional repressor of nem operon
MKTASNKIKILKLAQELIQKHGFNGFSYADLANIIGIRKASIHHYFPTKADLGISVIQLYRETFNDKLNEIDANGGKFQEKIQAYAKLYEEVLRENRLCLCGMLASDIQTLPRSLQKEIQGFFTDNVKWIAKILTTSKQFKLASAKRLDEIAWFIISSLQGFILTARMLNQPKIFIASSQELIAQMQKS